MIHPTTLMVIFATAFIGMFLFRLGLKRPGPRWQCEAALHTPQPRFVTITISTRPDTAHDRPVTGFIPQFQSWSWPTPIPKLFSGHPIQTIASLPRMPIKFVVRLLEEIAAYAAELEAIDAEWAAGDEDEEELCLSQEGSIEQANELNCASPRPGA